MEEKWFYTKKAKFRKVNEEEFNDFLKNYPRKLDFDVCGICEPPAISYNDFELACYWPYSVVARTYAYDNDPESYYYEKKENRFFEIMENYNECFESRTGKTMEEIDKMEKKIKLDMSEFKTYIGGLKDNDE